MMSMLSIKAMLMPVTIGPYIGGFGNTSGMSIEASDLTTDGGPSYLEDYSSDNLVDYDGEKLEDY